LEVSLLDRPGLVGCSFPPGDGSSGVLGSSEGGGVVENHFGTVEGSGGHRRARSLGDSHRGVESSLGGISKSGGLSSSLGVVVGGKEVEGGNGGVVGLNLGVVVVGHHGELGVAHSGSGSSLPDGARVGLSSEESGHAISVSVNVRIVRLVSDLSKVRQSEVRGNKVVFDGVGPGSNVGSQEERSDRSIGDDVGHSVGLEFNPVEVEGGEVGFLELESGSSLGVSDGEFVGALVGFSEICSGNGDSGSIKSSAVASRASGIGLPD